MPRTRVLSAMAMAAVVAAVPIVVTAGPASAATKYGITCKVGGLTAVAKPPIPGSPIAFTWYAKDGSFNSRVTVYSGVTSAPTPPNAAKVDVRQYLTNEMTSFRPLAFIGCR
ncbi:MAG: hypothetical protein F2842_01040 [Actinobacteria bacterium]|uniref:Unannotated protein n=1 Tax=freshwater metagenome TaxID=449393 RepID=A0A6J7IH94_9ZZZZ|nr:hypothetical protein [Actinomycetota bacterium]